MKAYTVHKYGTEDVLKSEKVDIPKLQNPTDILVQNKAFSMNPVDAKKRTNFGNTSAKLEAPFILGFDGAGIVKKVNNKNSKFKVGDEVYYSGVLSRNGSNAEYTVVDERIVAKKPKSLSFLRASAIPLVSLTAWEGIFEQLGVCSDASKNKSKSILIINGAGGVGSTAIQIAKKVAGLTVLTTASRDETSKWVKSLGADHVLNHRKDLVKQLQAIEQFKGGVDYIFNCHDLSLYFDVAPNLLKPGGKIVFITGTGGKKFDIGSYMFKRLTVTYEFMFSKPLLGYDVESQGEILSKVADLYDKKVLKDTVTKTLKWDQIKEGHKLLDSGKTIGKIVISIDN